MHPQQRMKQAAAAQQQQQLMQQALLLQQQQQAQPPLFPGHHHPHPGLLAAPQMEPIVSGNLPPGFDSSTCRSVYVGNINLQVTDAVLQEVFQSIGPVEGCKLIRKEKSSFGFIDYYDRRYAALAILSLNGRPLYGQPIKVNWAYTSTQREDTSGHFNIFVGDLCPEVTDATLFAFFSGYSTCSDARVMWDQKTGRSRGFGFVSFRNQQDAQSAINDLNGASAGEEKQIVDSKVDLTNGTSESGKENLNEDGPESNPQFTTVYVGNLPHEATNNDVHMFFHSLGAGSIEEVRVTRDKGFGFVRYSTHEEAALAIQMGNGQLIGGRQIKCSWGSKPTPPGTASSPLPPPALATFSTGVSATDFMAYQRLALSKMATNPALMGQHALKHVAALGMGGGASQSIYDGGFQGINTATATTSAQQQQQQLMYY
ncbi:unnamed protein product [Miscanthus lutarioriparius]|uniref:RRM domain-containing protein n=1 Tax=Miscanthus lutarioriparius TaxID=422564 RepID=A0A811QAE1_9POAL|nr:unnamed protein product [Miscanthus lutarioriparius]